jgi:hypothetical protein
MSDMICMRRTRAVRQMCGTTVESEADLMKRDLRGGRLREPVVRQGQASCEKQNEKSHR